MQIPALKWLAAAPFITLVTWAILLAPLLTVLLPLLLLRGVRYMLAPLLLFLRFVSKECAGR